MKKSYFRRSVNSSSQHYSLVLPKWLAWWLVVFIAIVNKSISSHHTPVKMYLL